MSSKTEKGETEMMSYSQNLTAQKIMRNAIASCERIGVDIRSRNADMQLMSCAAEGIRQAKSNSGRAFDADMSAEMKSLIGADACDGRVWDEDMGELRAWCETQLGKSGDPNRRRFISKLRTLLDAELGRDDESELRGRATKDQERDGRRPWDAYEPGMTREGRTRLARDRRLAARAADRAPAGKSFLGQKAVPDSDLARLDAMAASTFNL
jgi:hypothetical protein